MRFPSALIIGSLALLAGCASEQMPPPDRDAGVERAVSQPIRDLSLIRDVAPPVLQRAAAGPYDAAGLEPCAAAQAEVSELDAALGPDLGSEGKASGLTVEGLAGDLVGGAIGLPFRGVVRHITGAEQRDQALRTAVLSGMVRRAYLKGRMAVAGCALPPPPQVSPASEHIVRHP